MVNKNSRIKIALLAVLIFLIGLATFISISEKSSTPEMSYSDLITAIETKEVESLEFSTATYPRKATVKFKNGFRDPQEVVIFDDSTDLVQQLKTNNIKFSIVEPINPYGVLTPVIGVLFVIIALIAVQYFFPQNHITGLFGSENKKKPPKSTVTFADICGIDPIKDEVMEVVQFLRNPAKFATMGAKLPKGMLFTGEPGVGKTMLAKAIANESGAAFISCTGSEFIEMFVGVGASRVRSLFKQAREQAPVVIFIDEIDSVGAKRSHFREADNTLNQLLAEMDGVESTNGIVVIGATNRIEILDNALLRPGRFDRKIYIPKPNLDGRRAILFKALERVRVSPEGINTENASKITSTFAGADLVNAVNEAAIAAVRNGEPYITTARLDEAIHEAIMGKPSLISASDYDKRKTAIHEAGHALMIHYLTDPEDPISSPDPIFVGTMRPRGQALGYVWSIPKGEYDIVSYTKDYMLNRISISFGGRVAEEIEYGPNSACTAAIGDIQTATKLALDMVTKFGFTETLGHINPSVLIQEHFHGSVVQDLIIQGVKKILDEQYERAKSIISAHHKELLLVAEAMMEQDLTGAQIAEIIISGNLDKFREEVPALKEKYIFRGSTKNQEEVETNAKKPGNSHNDDKSGEGKGNTVQIVEVYG